MTPVYVVKRPNVAQFNVFNFARFQPFSFTATEGDQTDFTLPVVPISVILLAINGTTQDAAKSPPDFIVDGDVITLSDGVDLGDKVYGVYQY